MPHYSLVLIYSNRFTLSASVECSHVESKQENQNALNRFSLQHCARFSSFMVQLSGLKLGSIDLLAVLHHAAVRWCFYLICVLEKS